MHRLLSYLRYLFRARGPWRLHSPFVYDFCLRVLQARRGEEPPPFIGHLRRQLENSREMLDVLDLGAGRTGRRVLGRIARRSAIPARQGALLFRLVRRYQPARCLELGSNLGISALYQLAGNPEMHFIGIEGSPALARKAVSSLQSLFPAARVLTGDFDEVIFRPELLDYRPDLVFLDGNHRYAPTMRYFKALLPRVSEGGIWVMHDIHWSAEMERAWAEISAHPEVSVSIDLFHLGICFIRRPQAKEAFVLRF